MSNKASQKKKRNKIHNNDREPYYIDSKSSINVYKREKEKEDEDIQEEVTKSEISEENLAKIFEKLEAEYKDLFDDEFIKTYEKDLKKKELINIIREKDNKRQLENKLNILKIYMDLKDLFVEELIKGSFSEFLEKMVNQSNCDKQKESFEKKMKNFNDLCVRIEMNLYEKIETGAIINIFFGQINPMYYKFLNMF